MCRRQGCAVGSVGGHRVIGVDNCRHTAGQRDLVTGHAIGIAAAVVALMVFEDDRDRHFRQPGGRFQHGQSFLDVALDQGIFIPRKHARFAGQPGIDRGMADILEQGAHGQLFELGSGEVLLVTEGDDQRSRRDGMFGGIGIELLEAGQRHQRIGIAQHRFDHLADHRLQPASLDLTPGAGGEHQFSQVVVGLRQQATGAAPLLTQRNLARRLRARPFGQPVKTLLDIVQTGHRRWRQVDTLIGVDADFDDAGLTQLADMRFVANPESGTPDGMFDPRFVQVDDEHLGQQFGKRNLADHAVLDSGLLGFAGSTPFGFGHPPCDLGFVRFALLALALGIGCLAAGTLFRLTGLVGLPGLSILAGRGTCLRGLRFARLQFCFAARGIGFAACRLVGLLLLLHRALKC